MSTLAVTGLLAGFDAALRVVCGALLVCLVLALPCVWFDEKGVHPLARLRDLLRGQSWTGRALLCACLVLDVLVGGSKTDARVSRGRKTRH